MRQLIEGDEDKELSGSSEFEKKLAKKKKLEAARKGESNKDDAEDDEDKDDRPASFFTKPRRRDRKSASTDDNRDERHSLFLDGFETDNKKERNEAKGMTEAEVNEAFSAIIDGWSRELRNEFDQTAESSVAELEAVAVAAFVDSLRENIETDDVEITEGLLDKALEQALEDLLGINEAGTEDLDQIESQDSGGGSSGGDSNGTGGGGNGSGSSGSSGGASYNNPTTVAHASAPVSAVIAANATVGDQLAGGAGSRGKGLLIGGVVGYIIGQRHGRKRAEDKLQPEIDELEEQVAELYDSLASREYIIRQVVQELAARQLNKQQTGQLAKLNASTVDTTNLDQPDASKEINPPSLVIPAAFATLLVANRLMTDVSDERFTWGKDVLVGGVSGYMVGRRHGRKRTEARIKSEMEQLEEQVSNLQGDLASQDSVIDAMVRVAREADQTSAQEIADLQGAGQVAVSEQEVVKGKPSESEKQLVDVSIDRIAASRKNREIKRHKEHLAESGKASVIGKLNMMSNVFVERRLMDGTENSSKRKPIEKMNEEELLAMSQNMYVDDESAIDLYNKGRVEVEVLRESVKQYWRKTGDYELTLRKNLKPDESAINDIRENLARAYKSILDNAEPS